MSNLKEKLSLLRYVGIELEYTDFAAATNPALCNYIRNLGYMFTHDASVESPSRSLATLPVKNISLNSNINDILIRKQTIGGEIVSKIIDTSDTEWIKYWDGIFSHLKLSGERSNSPRGSIHIHVNTVLSFSTKNDFYFLLASWALAGHLEKFFYRIGGMGRKQRGENMDYIYYRPITGNGPHIVFDGEGNTMPLLNYDAVLGSNNYEEFFYRCGAIVRAGENKYHPSRYLWINYFNLLKNGEHGRHIEFRVFNKTMRADYLYATVELCKAFVAFSFKLAEMVAENYKAEDIKKNLTQSFPVVSILDSVDENDYFSHVMEILELSERIRGILCLIWRKSPFAYFSNIPSYSHLERTNIFEYGNSYNPEKIKYRGKMPDYNDIHTLEKEKIFVFPEEIL